VKAAGADREPVLNPTSEGFNPEFFTEVQRIGGGAEAEVFVFHQAGQRGFLGREMVEVYLERARRTPQGKMMFLNSATAASFAGNPDLTLFSYFTYLLVAGPEREIYWTARKGTRDPALWYREFDLDSVQRARKADARRRLETLSPTPPV
jgi:hypothetical protein